MRPDRRLAVRLLNAACKASRSLRLEDGACGRFVGDQPVEHRPFSAALIAETLERPTAAPMVSASAGTRGGMLVRRRFVPPSMM